MIRKAKSVDYKSICRLVKAPELADSLADTDLPSYFKKIIGKNDLFLVAEINKEVAGFILAEEILGKCVYAHLMAVDDKFRGQGIGGNLIEFLKKEARKKKIKYIFLFAPKKEQHLNEFYKKRGFNKKEGDYALFDIRL